MLHGVHLGNGTAQYRNCYAQGWKVEKGSDLDGSVTAPTGQPHGPSKNTANTALYGTQGVFWRYGKG